MNPPTTAQVLLSDDQDTVFLSDDLMKEIEALLDPPVPVIIINFDQEEQDA